MCTRGQHDRQWSVSYDAPATSTPHSCLIHLSTHTHTHTTRRQSGLGGLGLGLGFAAESIDRVSSNKLKISLKNIKIHWTGAEERVRSPSVPSSSVF